MIGREKVNEAAEEFASTPVGVYRALAGQATGAQLQRTRRRRCAASGGEPDDGVGARGEGGGVGSPGPLSLPVGS
ncbi:hypothetical protein BH24ACT19_BH24ACT19_20950 [soil metagenome]|jgi:hypothetical protein